jgi:hypothetical protein
MSRHNRTTCSPLTTRSCGQNSCLVPIIEQTEEKTVEMGDCVRRTSLTELSDWWARNLTQIQASLAQICDKHRPVGCIRLQIVHTSLLYSTNYKIHEALVDSRVVIKSKSCLWKTTADAPRREIFDNSPSDLIDTHQKKLDARKPAMYIDVNDGDFVQSLHLALPRVFYRPWKSN